MTNRRRIIAGLAGLSTVPVLLGGRALAQSARPIAVGLTSQTAAQWPTYAAEELGYFKRYNLDPSFIVVGSAAATAQQLVAGSLDVGESSSTQVVEAVQGGAKMRYFCEEMSTPPYSFVAQKQYKKYRRPQGQDAHHRRSERHHGDLHREDVRDGGVKMSDVDFTYAGGTGRPLRRAQVGRRRGGDPVPAVRFSRRRRRLFAARDAASRDAAVPVRRLGGHRTYAQSHARRRGFPQGLPARRALADDPDEPPSGRSTCSSSIRIPRPATRPSRTTSSSPRAMSFRRRGVTSSQTFRDRARRAGADQGLAPPLPRRRRTSSTTAT